MRVLGALACLLLLAMISSLKPAIACAADPGQEQQAAETPVPAPASDEDQEEEDDEEPRQHSVVLGDIAGYITSPLRWNGLDWLAFGGAVGATWLAHQYDAQVRATYTHNSPYYLRPNATNFDLQDAAPVAALFVGTWGYALWTGDYNGHNEAWAMLEAATFSGATTYALRYAAGRVGPYETTDPDLWRRGGPGSFPSLHATLAFAVGTVMAESGSDDYRWLRRLLGYGVGVLTSYERVKHNQHWLSDTVAGAAIGAAAARFAMGRRYPQDEDEEGYAGGLSGRLLGGLSVVPMAGGAMLTYSMRF